MADEVGKPTTISAPAVVAGQQTPVAPQQPAVPQQTEATPANAGVGGTGVQEPARADPAPKATELKLPEGVKVDQQFLEKAKAAWKEAGMPVEQQQKTLDVYASHIAEQNKAFEAQQAKQREEWRASIKADPKLGGAQFDASLAVVAKAVDKFFGPEGRKLFDATGFGDHPAIFRALHQIGTRISEDSIAGTISEAPRANTLANIYDHPTSRAQLK